MKNIRKNTLWLLMQGRTPAGITPSITGMYIPHMEHYPETWFMVRSLDALYEAITDGGR